MAPAHCNDGDTIVEMLSLLASAASGALCVVSGRAGPLILYAARVVELRWAGVAAEGKRLRTENEVEKKSLTFIFFFAFLFPFSAVLARAIVCCCSAYNAAEATTGPLWRSGKDQGSNESIRFFQTPHGRSRLSLLIPTARSSLSPAPVDPTAAVAVSSAEHSVWLCCREGGVPTGLGPVSAPF